MPLLQFCLLFVWVSDSCWEKQKNEVALSRVWNNDTPSPSEGAVSICTIIVMMVHFQASHLTIVGPHLIELYNPHPGFWASLPFRHRSQSVYVCSPVLRPHCKAPQYVFWDILHCTPKLRYGLHGCLHLPKNDKFRDTYKGQHSKEGGLCCKW